MPPVGIARIWLKVVPKMTSHRIGWIARVTSSLRSWRSFCSSTRQNVLMREASSPTPVRLCRSAQTAGGSTSRSDTAQPSLLTLHVVERLPGVVTEHVLEARARSGGCLEVLRGPEGAQAAPVQERHPVAERVGLLHVVRREQHGHAVVTLHLRDSLPHAVARHGV